MLTYEQIYSQLEQKSERELVGIHNAYCVATNDMNSCIYENTEDNLLQLLPDNPLKAFYTGRTCANKYSATDDWLQLDGYSNPRTASNPVDCLLFLSDLAKWLEQNEDAQEYYLEVPEDEEE